jgi:zinc protease
MTATPKKVIGCLAVALLVLTSFAASAQTPQSTPPPPAPPRSLRVPIPTQKTLSNGLRVIVIERQGTPLVSAQLLIKNGGEVDPPQLAGLTDVTASLLTRGTATRDATQIAEAVEAFGGSLASGAGWDSSSATVDVMSAWIGPALEILADVVRHPTFRTDEIERLRQQYLDNLTVDLGEPGTIAHLAAERVVFGDSPYGHPFAGTAESLARIKRADVVRLHDKYYRPDNAILVIGGDITASAAFALAQRYFSVWRKPAQPLPPFVFGARLSDATNRRVLVIDKPDAGQAAVLVARTGIARTDADYFSGMVANSVLNGYSGRLNQEIRIKRGLSYGAGSALDARRGVGTFVASAQTKNESGAQVVVLLMGEVSRLETAAVSEAELTPRKAALIGNFARNLEQVDGLVSQVGSQALLGLNLDEINHYIDQVQSVTAAAVQKFAGARLAASGASIIVVGNAKEFLPALQKQFNDVEVIPLAALDLNNGSLRKTGARALKE